MLSLPQRAAVYAVLGSVLGLLGGYLGGCIIIAIGGTTVRSVELSTKFGVFCGLVLGPLTGFLQWRWLRAVAAWTVFTVPCMLVVMRHPMAQFGVLPWLRAAVPRFIVPQCAAHALAALVMVAALDVLHAAVSTAGNASRPRAAAELGAN